MNNRNDLIVNWAVKRIEAEYKDDVPTAYIRLI
jgi:hypothetical protein